jgi:hypothetical protein
VVNVKGAFLHGEFDDGNKIYIKIPLRFEDSVKLHSSTAKEILFWT